MAEGEVRRRRPSPERAARYLAERDAIVHAAYELIGSGQPNGASVHDILKHVGLSTRAFYRHFPSKDDLILFMYRADSVRVTRSLEDVVARATTPSEALAAWVDEYLQAAYNPRKAAKARVLSSVEASSVPGFSDVFKEEMDKQRATVQVVLEEGLRDGSFPYADPEEDSYALHALVCSYLSARLFGDRTVSLATARDHTVKLFMRGLGCTQDAPKAGKDRPGRRRAS
jgi:AcrR family transcriptional regulator